MGWMINGIAIRPAAVGIFLTNGWEIFFVNMYVNFTILFIVIPGIITDANDCHNNESIEWISTRGLIPILFTYILVLCIVSIIT